MPRTRWIRRAGREDGQTMAEYAVVLGVITLAVVSALLALSSNFGTMITRTASYI